MSTRYIMEVIYETIGKCVKNIVLPVGSTLVPSVFLCIGIVMVTSVCKILGVYTFLDYRGAIVALLIVCIQCYYERRSNNDLLRLYSSIQLRFGENERREEGSGLDSNSTRDTASSSSSDNETGSGAEYGVQDGTRRLDRSSDVSPITEWFEELDGQDETDDN